MTDSERRLRDALAKIAEAADAAIHVGDHDGHDHGDDVHDHHDDEAGGRRVRGGRSRDPELHCVPKRLPGRLLVPAAATAMRINPVNGPNFGPVAEAGAGLTLDPLRIAVLVGKYWGPTPRKLTVSFMEPTRPELRARIVEHLNAWSRTGCVSFVETRGTGTVRVSREGGGYWSYLGTDILHIPQGRPTMNLEGFAMSTPESEFKRVVRHEAGHTLGFPHEHMRRDLVSRLDREKAYDYFWRTQGWDRRTVDQQVLTPLSERSLMRTPADQDSIMCYQLPGSITRDGEPIRGGGDINATDFAFVGRIYPKGAGAGAPRRQRDLDRREEPAAAAAAAADDWDEAEDVEVPEEFMG